MRKILILLFVFSMPCYAWSAVSTGSIVAASVAASSAARQSTVSHNQSQNSQYGEIKAVCPCSEFRTTCNDYWGEFPKQTFHDRAVSCSGREDAKVIGINTYENEIYVSW